MIESIVAAKLALIGSVCTLGFILFLCVQTVVSWQLRKYLLCEVSLPKKSYCAFQTKLKIRSFLPNLHVNLDKQRTSEKVIAVADVQLLGKFQIHIRESIFLKDFSFEE